MRKQACLIGSILCCGPAVAVLGATSARERSGARTLENLVKGGFEGALFAVNPRYESVCGVPCFATLAALPEPVEHVIFAVSDARIEAALDEAIATGARGDAHVVAVLENDQRRRCGNACARRSARRLRGLRRERHGFLQLRDGVWACGFRRASTRAAATSRYISHSGSGMCGIVDCEERIDFNFVVSTGQELAVTHGRVSRFRARPARDARRRTVHRDGAQPAGPGARFAKAQQRRIPIVALKAGRTELSARLTVSHSGAIAGDDAVYQALFERYGVQRVHDMDKLATALIMFAQPHPVGDGAWSRCTTRAANVSC